MKKGNMRSIKQYWKAAFVVMMLAAWVSIPFVIGKVEAGGGIPIVVRTANLASPTGTINPHGHAEWELYSNNNREIEIEVEDLSLAVGTVLTAVVDGNNIGTLVVDLDRQAKLKLKTEDGQPVPVTNDGSTVVVLNGSAVVVQGVFGGGGPNPTPSVSPTGTPTGTPTASPTVSPSPNGGDLFAGLTGPTLNGVVPTGWAQFEIHSSRTELEARVRQVNLPIGTALNVVVNGTPAGNLVLESGGEGRLRLRSDNGQTVPAIVVGSTIAMRNGSTTVLSGTFAGFTGPTPSPTPTGTPGPTPSPSPGFGRSFEAHLTGAQATPSVTTAGNGEIKLTLNATETQATVFGEFHNLSSNQTGARIVTTVGTATTIRDLGIVGGQNGNFPSVTFDVSAAQVQMLRAGLVSAVITSVNNPNGEIAGRLTQRSSDSDFDGNGSNDFAVFRPSNAVWYSFNESGSTTESFGAANDRIVSGDYDGDGKTDIAMYKDGVQGSTWEIRRSSDGGVTSIAFGLPTDTPVRGDFDGDGRLDPAVYRASTGTWYIQKSDNTGYTYLQFGAAEDKPIPADMDGDGKDDIVVFRPSDGTWHWRRSSDGGFAGMRWGMNGDIPIRGDFDGDGKADVTVFRPSNGIWYTVRSSDNGFQGALWGLSDDIPVAGNYDGDGKTDIAIFRPSDGHWYILRSVDGGFQAFHFGLIGDKPLIAR